MLTFVYITRVEKSVKDGCDEGKLSSREWKWLVCGVDEIHQVETLLMSYVN